MSLERGWGDTRSVAGPNASYSVRLRVELRDVGHRQDRVGGRRADPELERARFDDVREVATGRPERGDRDVERHQHGLARRQSDAPETDEFPNRPGDRGDRIAPVELNDLISTMLAGRWDTEGLPPDDKALPRFNRSYERFAPWLIPFAWLTPFVTREVDGGLDLG